MKKHNLRKLGSLLEDSWKIYKKNFSHLIKTYLYVLIGFIPMIATAILFFAYSKSFSFLPWILQVVSGVVLVYAAVFSLGFLIYMAVNSYIGMFIAIKKDFSLSPKENIEKAKKYFWSYIVISFLTFILILFWFFMFIIPAIVFSIFYSMAIYALIFEDKREMDAISRSKELITGKFWPVFGRILVLFAIVIIVSGIFSSLRSMSDEGSLWFSLMSLLEQVVGFILTPFYLVYNYLIFKDLSEKKA